MTLPAPLPEHYELDSPERAATLAALPTSAVVDPTPIPNPFARKPLPRPLADCTANEIMAHYPSLVAHLICESLGYLSPDSAAYCLRDAATHQIYWCELHMHKTECVLADRIRNGQPIPRDEKGYVQRDFYEQTMREMTRSTLDRAIQLRSHHTGYMASYRQARNLVAYRQLPAGQHDIGLEFMSW